MRERERERKRERLTKGEFTRNRVGVKAKEEEKR